MSTIKSSAENLTLNADGANNDIIFQSNGSNVATLDQAGLLTATTFAGSAASLTNVPAANITGTLPAIDGSNLTGAGATHTSAGSAPGSPAIGDFWHDTALDKLYIRTNDGTSNIWLQI